LEVIIEDVRYTDNSGWKGELIFLVAFARNARADDGDGSDDDDEMEDEMLRLDWAWAK